MPHKYTDRFFLLHPSSFLQPPLRNGGLSRVRNYAFLVRMKEIFRSSRRARYARLCESGQRPPYNQNALKRFRIFLKLPFGLRDNTIYSRLRFFFSFFSPLLPHKSIGHAPPPRTRFHLSPYIRFCRLLSERFYRISHFAIIITRQKCIGQMASRSYRCKLLSFRQCRLTLNRYWRL